MVQLFSMLSKPVLFAEFRAIRIERSGHLCPRNHRQGFDSMSDHIGAHGASQLDMFFAQEESRLKWHRNRHI